MASKGRILIVEDEKDVAELISVHLKRNGFDTLITDNAEEALCLLGSHACDLLILDWTLSGMSGIEICKIIRGEQGRSHAELPIIMITARAETADIVLGLEMGASDFITKPFEIPILLARVKAVMRRNHMPGEKSAKQYTTGALRVNLDTYEAFCGERELQLTATEFKILTALIESPGRVLSRNLLIDHAIGVGVAVTSRTIDTHVFSMRKKLGECSDLVETLRGVGYRVKGLA